MKWHEFESKDHYELVFGMFGRANVYREGRYWRVLINGETLVQRYNQATHAMYGAEVQVIARMTVALHKLCGLNTESVKTAQNPEGD